MPLEISWKFRCGNFVENSVWNSVDEKKKKKKRRRKKTQADGDGGISAAEFERQVGNDSKVGDAEQSFLKHLREAANGVVREGRAPASEPVGNSRVSLLRVVDNGVGYMRTIWSVVLY